MRPRSTTTALVGALCVALTSCGLSSPPDDPDDVAAAFVAALAARDLSAAAALTTDPGHAAADLDRITEGLGSATLTARVEGVGARDFRYASEWDLGQGRSWSYRTIVPLARTPDGARVSWSPSVVHPHLAQGEVLELRGTSPTPPRVLDASGRTVMRTGRVTVVQLDPAAADRSATALAAALAPLALDITPPALRDSVARSGGRPVTVVSLRDDDFAQVKTALQAVPGLTFGQQSRLLTEGGLDSPVLHPELATTDPADRGWQVARVDAGGDFVEQLAGERATSTGDVALTLDRRRQLAAQRAVDTVTSPAALVALQPSTGGVLAVAQNAAADAAGPIALTGLYPPGSTFKTVTAVAALQAGVVSPDTVLPCPPTATVRGRQISNDEEFDLGEVTLHTAYAHSCNTTFAGIGAELPRSALPAAAVSLGLGSDWEVPGITTVTGSVPEPASDAEQVEASIGQGRVVASPFGMALVAATVAAGRVPVPQLVVGRPGVARTPAAARIPDGVRAELAAMMRETVASGSATRLRGFAGAGGKTGTAQFGDGSAAHGWFIGTAPGDLAFAVLVVGAGSSGPAVEVSAAFLRGGSW